MSLRKQSQSVRLILLALLLGAVTVAQAATYVGRWDPFFGNPYSSSPGGDPLWFEIDASLTVPNTCVGVTGVCAGAAFDFVDVALKSNDKTTTFSTLSFGSELNADNSSGIFLNYGSGGVFLGPNAVTFSFKNGSLPSSANFDEFTVWFLQDAYLLMRRPVSGDFCDGFGGDLASTFSEGGGFNNLLGYKTFDSNTCYAVYVNDYVNNPYEPGSGWRVPEPASLGLMAVALLGLGFARRKADRRG